MKVLLYSDIHHGSALRYGSVENGVNSRLLASLRLEERISALAKEYGVDLIVFGGDLVESSAKSHINDVVRRRLLDLFGEDGIPRIYVVGNHDLYFKEISFFGSVSGLLDVYCDVVDSFRVLNFLDLRIGIIGWLMNDTEAVDSLRKNKNVDMWVLHKEVGGAFLRKDFVAGPGSFDINVLKSLGVPVFVGHHHVPHRFDNVLFMGSVYRIDLSDCDDVPRGCYIYDVEASECEFIRLDEKGLVLLEQDVADFSDVERLLVDKSECCVVMRVRGKRGVLSQIMGMKADLIKRFDLENLVFQPVVVEEDRVLEVVGQSSGMNLVVGDSQQERLRNFVYAAKVEGLDRERLYQKGLEVLKDVQSKEG